MRGKLGLKPQKRATLLVTKPCLETLIQEGNRVFSEERYPSQNGERLLAQDKWRKDHESKLIKQQTEAEARRRVRRILGRAI